MRFQHPDILYFLFALAIPVIVHLFNFRRYRTVYFSNLSILKNLEQESVRTKKLRNVIVLAMRLVCFVGLVVAFAGPYFPDKDNRDNEDRGLCGIYIDNSMSMNAMHGGVSLLEAARTSAKETVMSMKPTESFVLITNEQNPANEFPSDRNETASRLDAVANVALSMTLEDVVRSFEMIKSNYGYENGLLIVFSDFQDNMTDLGPYAEEGTRIVLVRMSPDERNNIYIDSVWLATPVLQQKLDNELHVRVVNESDQTVSGIPVYMSIDGKITGAVNADIEKKSYTDIGFQILIDESGVRKGEVYINDFPIVFDDHLFFVLDVGRTIKVLELVDSDTEEDNSRLFMSDPLFSYARKNIFAVDNSALNDNQLIILNLSSGVNETMQQALLDFASQGGSVLMANSNLPDLEYMLKKLGVSACCQDTNTLKVDYVASKNPFFADMIVTMPDNADLPSVSAHYELSGKGVNGYTSIMRLQNGDPFMLKVTRGKGNVFVMSSPLDGQCNEFKSKTIYVPVMYKIAFLGSQADELCHTMENGVSFRVPREANNFERLEIVNEQNGYRSLVSTGQQGAYGQVRIGEMLPEAGFYEIVQDGKQISTVAFNYSRAESKMEFASESSLVEMFKAQGFENVSVLDAVGTDFGDLSSVLTGRNTLYMYFILLSLAAIVAEILILRFWKS